MDKAVKLYNHYLSLGGMIPLNGFIFILSSKQYFIFKQMNEFQTGFLWTRQ